MSYIMSDRCEICQGGFDGEAGKIVHKDGCQDGFVKMREIKFRAYVKSLQQVFDVVNIDFRKGKVVVCNSAADANRQLVCLKDVELMQYVGTKDKNGVEIYEGDIVEDLDDELGVVKWDEVNVQFIIETEYEVYTFSSHYLGRDLWVRGNIYENPELLEDNDK